MSPSIANVIDLQISPPNNNNHQQTQINSNKQKKKQIISLLKQIKLYQTKISQLQKLNHHKKQINTKIEQQQPIQNKQIQIKVHKQQTPQINIYPITYQESNQLSKIQQKPNNDPFKYQIDMLRQQNNLLKQQNDLLKQQTTLKLKITKSDQIIYNQSSSPIINSNIINPINSISLYQNIPSPSILPNYQSQKIPTLQQQNQPKNFIRSNSNPINFQSNALSPLQSHVYQNSQHSLPILPQSNSKIIRPQSIKRKDAGKILFVKSKYSSEKPNDQTQGYLSPPYSLDNYQFPQQILPQNPLKSAILSQRKSTILSQRKSTILSQPQLIHKKQSSKTVLSSQVKTNNLSFKKRKVSNSKQKLIKQDAFDKINLIKNTLTERKSISKKQSLTQSRQKIDSKYTKQFQLKIQSNKKLQRPLHNDVNFEKGQKFVIKKDIQVLQFNTEKQKIDLDTIGLSSLLTDKKPMSDKKSQISFHNIDVSKLNSFQDFLKLAPKVPSLKRLPFFQSTQQELLILAKQTFPLFNVLLLQNTDTDLNIKKFKNCVFFGINSIHNILWHYDGKIYYGQWKLNQQGQGQKSGQGLQFYPNKYIFKGQFIYGKRNGQGILYLFNSTNESIYIGQFVNGKKQGRGKIIDQNGNIFQGEWYDDKRHGYGLFKSSHGDIYEGTFVKGERQGYGVQKFKNGDLYRGEYKQDKFEGKGQYVWKNTSQYEGEFRQGRRNGYGVWRSSNKIDAEIYQGEYLNDKKEGYGIYRWHNGSYYQGYFKQDKKHGIGKTCYQNGKIAVLQWADGISVRKLDRKQWPEFLLDQNQTSIKPKQKPKITKSKINTFFQYEEPPSHQQTNYIDTIEFDGSRGQINRITENRHESQQSYQNQQTKIYGKIFKGELREAKYQPIGSNLNVFNL